MPKWLPWAVCAVLLACLIIQSRKKEPKIPAPPGYVIEIVHHPDHPTKSFLGDSRDVPRTDRFEFSQEKDAEKARSDVLDLLIARTLADQVPDLTKK